MRSARLFAAVAFTPGEKRELEAVQQLLRGHCSAGRFVNPALMHVTLHFFGQTDLVRLGAIESAMREAAASIRPFTLSTTNAGAFGRGGVSVLWLGLGDGSEELRTLQASLDKALANQGFPPEGRPFRAHITLARDARLTGSVGEAPLPQVRLGANEITLMESTQARGSLEYIPLLNVPLGNR